MLFFKIPLLSLCTFNSRISLLKGVCLSVRERCESMALAGRSEASLLSIKM